MPHVATSRGHWGSSLYTGLLPRRQSDTSLATICASFRLARVNAHGGAVGACDNVVDSKPESRSTGIALGERLRRGLLDGHADDLIGSGVDSEVRRPIRQDIVYLKLAKPWPVVFATLLTCTMLGKVPSAGFVTGILLSVVGISLYYGGGRK